MGYFLVSAPELTTPRRPHCPPFEGEIVGFKAIQHADAPQLFTLRDKWLDAFISMLEEDNDNAPPRPWMLEWLDSSGTFPKTGDQLAADLANLSSIQRAAVACLDAWHAL